MPKERRRPLSEGDREGSGRRGNSVRSNFPRVDATLPIKEKKGTKRKRCDSGQAPAHLLCCVRLSLVLPLPDRYWPLFLANGSAFPMWGCAPRRGYFMAPPEGRRGLGRSRMGDFKPPPSSPAVSLFSVCPAFGVGGCFSSWRCLGRGRKAVESEALFLQAAIGQF